MTAAVAGPLARLLLSACLAACGTAAVAQTVYRCGEGGRVYQAEPCSGGKPVDVSDPRTDEQRRAAREAAGSEARLAAQLERERRAREAATVPARAGGMGAAPAPAASVPYVVHGRRHVRHGGVRYFADGTPVPPVYRVPAPPAAPRRSR